MPAGAATASRPPNARNSAGCVVRSGICVRSARSCARPRFSSPGRPVTGELLPADRRGESTPPGLPARPCGRCVAHGLLRLGVPSAVAADADRRLPRAAGPDHPRSQPWDLRRPTGACRAAPRLGPPRRPQAGRPVDARARLAGHPPPPVARHHATRPAGVTSSRSCRAELHPGRSGPVVGADITQQRTGEGWLYTSFADGRRLAASELVASMGTVGDALDNAVAESFFATLECELLDRYPWPTRAGLRTAIFDFIEVFYNRQRRHSTLDYHPPAAYEQHHPSAASAA